MKYITDAQDAYDNLKHWTTERGKRLIAEQSVKVRSGVLPLHPPERLANLGTMLTLFHLPHPDWRGKKDGRLRHPVALLDVNGQLVQIETEPDLRHYLDTVTIWYNFIHNVKQQVLTQVSESLQIIQDPEIKEGEREETAQAIITCYIQREELYGPFFEIHPREWTWGQMIPNNAL